jgi:hypothetical protein
VTLWLSVRFAGFYGLDLYSERVDPVAASRARERYACETRAVEPIERTARWEEGELPETYPYAV